MEVGSRFSDSGLHQSRCGVLNPSTGGVPHQRIHVGRSPNGDELLLKLIIVLSKDRLNKVHKPKSMTTNTIE